LRSPPPLFASPVGAETPHTTRIETRPVYGAVVTIEHGVRVWRPVPPTQHLIVNPDKVPLALSVEDPAAAYVRADRSTDRG
jgi:hypothetical protein